MSKLQLKEQRLLKKIELLETKKERMKKVVCEGAAPKVRFDPDPGAVEILEHPLFHINDYSYFRGKGYTDEEILKVWDGDMNMGVMKPNDWGIPTLERGKPAPEHPTRYPYLGMNESTEFGKLLEKAAKNKEKNLPYKKYMKEANDIAVKNNFKNWRQLLNVLGESPVTHYFLYIDDNPHPVMTSDNYEDLIDEQKYWENLGHHAEIRDDYSRSVMFNPEEEEFRRLMLGENASDEVNSVNDLLNAKIGSGKLYYRDPIFTEPRFGTFKQDYRVGDRVATPLGKGTIVDMYYISTDYLSMDYQLGRSIPTSRTKPRIRAKVKMDTFEDHDGNTPELNVEDLRHINE